MALGANETGIRTIPPIVVVLALIAAWIAEQVFPTGTGLPVLARIVVGIGLIAVPVAFVVQVFRQFSRAGSEYDVRKVPKELVTEGAFAYSRNPGYAAMVVACLGFALVFDNLWVIPAAIAAGAIIHYRVIIKEEALLEREFGEDYLRYKARVRRWI